MNNFTRIKTNNPELQVFADWDNDGFLVIENSRTGKHYIELAYNTHPDCYRYRCFFAFSKEQFIQGCQAIHLDTERGEKVASGGAGLFGIPAGLEAMANFYDELEARIRTECDPEEAYYEEYNNFECCIDWDGDQRAYEKVVSIWGRETADKIHRLRAMC